MAALHAEMEDLLKRVTKIGSTRAELAEKRRQELEEKLGRLKRQRPKGG
jgi:hypothetical protein